MKIRIIGPVGSGKTTLAHQISARTGLTVTSLDELNWERLTQGDRHREPAERQAILDRVLKQDSWLIEGTQYRSGQAVFDAADIIYVMDLPCWQVYCAIAKRWLQSRAHQAPVQYRELRPYLYWYGQCVTSERQAVMDMLTPYAEKTIILKSFDKINRLE